MRKTLALLAIVSGLIFAAGQSFGQLTLTGAGKLPAPAGYQGPGDIVSGASFFGGLYAYNAAYATGSNPAADICDAATGTTCTTVNILSTGYFDDATAAALPQCASSCIFNKLYDQTGNGHHVTSTSAGFTTAPILTFSVLSGRAVITFNGTSDRLVLAGVFSPSQPFSSYVVFKENNAASTSMVYWDGGGSDIVQLLSDGTVSPHICGLYAGSVGATADAPANTWNACIGILNGASSFVSANGTAGSTGNPGSSNAGANFFIGAGFPNGTDQFFNGTMYGAAVYSSALTSGQAASLSANAHTIGGF